MVYIWSVGSVKVEKKYYIQLFPQGMAYPIGAGLFDKIFSDCECMKVAKPEAKGVDLEGAKAIVYESVDEELELLMKPSDSGEMCYSLRFSNSDNAFPIEPDFAYMLQYANRLDPVNPDEMDPKDKGMTVYRIKPGKPACEGNDEEKICSFKA